MHFFIEVKVVENTFDRLFLNDKRTGLYRAISTGRTVPIVSTISARFQSYNLQVISLFLPEPAI